MEIGERIIANQPFSSLMGVEIVSAEKDLCWRFQSTEFGYDTGMTPSALTGRTSVTVVPLKPPWKICSIFAARGSMRYSLLP